MVFRSVWLRFLVNRLAAKGKASVFAHMGLVIVNIHLMVVFIVAIYYTSGCMILLRFLFAFTDLLMSPFVMAGYLFAWSLPSESQDAALRNNTGFLLAA
mgnify:CR=1 FL=1